MSLMFLKYMAKLKGFGGPSTRCSEPWLFESGLSEEWWEHVSCTALHISNRILTSTNDVSPLKKFFFEQPMLDYLQAFGSLGYCHIPIHLRDEIFNTKKTTIKNGIIVVNRNPISNLDTDLFVQRKYQSNTFSMIWYKPSQTQLASNNNEYKCFEIRQSNVLREFYGLNNRKTNLSVQIKSNRYESITWILYYDSDEYIIRTNI